MEKKYGRVLFKTPNASNLIETQSFNSIRFSNLDHKWYDADGKIHPEFENYKGKEFSLYFKIEQHDKNGVLVPFEGNIQLPYGLGELGPQDLDGVAVADIEDQKLVRNYKLLDKDENVDQMQATGFLAACFPNQKLEDSKIVRVFNLAAFTFDDEIEKMGTKLYFNELNYFAKYAGEILKGKLVDLEKVNEGSVKLPNTFLKYLQIMQLFQKELSKAEKEQNLNGNYIRETYRKYIEGICQENCIEWNEQKPGIFYNAKKELRTWVAATFVFLEMAMFDSKINPNREVRKTFLFQWFARLYTMQTSLINDLVSFRKEVESTQGVGCNKVYLLHNEKGLPLKDAMQKVLDKTNDITTQLVETGNLLCELHKGNKHVQRYVEKAKDMVYGHVQWITFSDRYHKDFVFDCVVN